MAQQTAQTRERIEVTGSNIKRIEGESALPVTVINRQDIEKTGATTAAELLNTLSAVSAGKVKGVSDGEPPLCWPDRCRRTGY